MLIGAIDERIFLEGSGEGIGLGGAIPIMQMTAPALGVPVAAGHAAEAEGGFFHCLQVGVHALT